MDKVGQGDVVAGKHLADVEEHEGVGTGVIRRGLNARV